MIAIDSTVRIKALNVDGFVDRISIARDGTMYQVVYWFDGSRREVWMHAREIVDAQTMQDDHMCNGSDQ